MCFGISQKVNELANPKVTQNVVIKSLADCTITAVSW